MVLAACGGHAGVEQVVAQGRRMGVGVGVGEVEGLVELLEVRRRHRQALL